MISTVEYKDTFIRYTDEGYGDPVVFLHGYLESLEIWDGFAGELSADYRVICVDLPGHGRSGMFSTVDTMAIMADSVKHVLEFLGNDYIRKLGCEFGNLFDVYCLGYVSPTVADIDTNSHLESALLSLKLYFSPVCPVFLFLQNEEDSSGFLAPGLDVLRK